MAFEDRSSTLIVGNERRTSDGMTYTVRSELPVFGLEELRSAPDGAPSERARYVELPDDFSELAESTAEDVTAPAETTYDKALTLQNWFRDEFDYSLDVETGHGTEAIDQFLVQRIGYCEQFAGTYAAMMRSLGIPARVAGGLPRGHRRPRRPESSYRVTGEDAHAWPEVHFEGLGWVPFEPTPADAAVHPRRAVHRAPVRPDRAGGPRADHQLHHDPTRERHHERLGTRARPRGVRRGLLDRGTRRTRGGRWHTVAPQHRPRPRPVGGPRAGLRRDPRRRPDDPTPPAAPPRSGR
ncbi:MAG: transglutaminase-like domain-containing protein [Acidimicrobiia bacterium]|nr:transglutaminase-like domain-containing protein [Acidimicrobiia bacterium]